MAKRKLLLADDSITIQKVVNLTFTDEGIDVIAVGNGNQAIEKLAEVTPDLVMADVHMPGLNGYQVCEQIRQNSKFQNVPVMLLVGSFEPFDENEARRVGADDYLTKPFQSIRQLINKVNSLLSQREAAGALGTNGDLELKEAPKTEPQERVSGRLPMVSNPLSQFKQITETAESRPASPLIKETTPLVSPVSESFSHVGMDDEMIETSPAKSFMPESVQTETPFVAPLFEQKTETVPVDNSQTFQTPTPTVPTESYNVQNFPTGNEPGDFVAKTTTPETWDTESDKDAQMAAAWGDDDESVLSQETPQTWPVTDFTTPHGQESPTGFATLPETEPISGYETAKMENAFAQTEETGTAAEDETSNKADNYYILQSFNNLITNPEAVFETKPETTQVEQSPAQTQPTAMPLVSETPIVAEIPSVSEEPIAAEVKNQDTVDWAFSDSSQNEPETEFTLHEPESAFESTVETQEPIALETKLEETETELSPLPDFIDSSSILDIEEPKPIFLPSDDDSILELDEPAMIVQAEDSSPVFDYDEATSLTTTEDILSPREETIPVTSYPTETPSAAEVTNGLSQLEEPQFQPEVTETVEAATAETVAQATEPIAFEPSVTEPVAEISPVLTPETGETAGFQPFTAPVAEFRETPIQTPVESEIEETTAPQLFTEPMPAETVIETGAEISVPIETGSQIVETPIVTPPVVQTERQAVSQIDASHISDELIDAIVEKVMQRLSDRIVREVAWDVVPDLAELIIKKMTREHLEKR